MRGSRRVRAGRSQGMPLGVKDVFCTEDVRTTACSHILDNFVPTYEFDGDRALWRDGAVLLGKTNNDEFAMGSSNETSHFGPVVSPWRRRGSNTKLVPGGSSGGSAAAVAARLCLGATGTDTGGSIRQPAAFTGIVGMRPTYGRCSRWGIVAYASSLDQAGPFARTVRDARSCCARWPGLTARIRPALNVRCPTTKQSVGASVKGMRIGIPKEYRIDGMAAEIEDLWQRGAQWLKDAGAEIVDISLPHTKYALPAYYIVAPAEASSNLARYDGVRYGLRVPGRDIDRACTRHARRRLRQGSAAAHHDRHLRAFRRLLRRLLPARAEGADADQARFRGRALPPASTRS